MLGFFSPCKQFQIPIFTLHWGEWLCTRIEIKRVQGHLGSLVGKASDSWFWLGHDLRALRLSPTWSSILSAGSAWDSLSLCPPPPPAYVCSLSKINKSLRERKEGRYRGFVTGSGIYSLPPPRLVLQQSSKSNPRSEQSTWWVYSRHRPLSFRRQMWKLPHLLMAVFCYSTSCFSNWPANEFPTQILVISWHMGEAVCNLLLPKVIPVLILHQK